METSFFDRYQMILTATGNKISSWYWYYLHYQRVSDRLKYQLDWNLESMNTVFQVRSEVIYYQSCSQDQSSKTKTSSADTKTKTWSTKTKTAKNRSRAVSTLETKTAVSKTTRLYIIIYWVWQFWYERAWPHKHKLFKNLREASPVHSESDHSSVATRHQRNWSPRTTLLYLFISCFSNSVT